jgi:hypothetical protein
MVDFMVSALEKYGSGDAPNVERRKNPSGQGPEKMYKLTDGHQLFLMVMPSGSKLWKWNYRYNGLQRTMGIGSYPMFSLLDARACREEARRVLAEGKTRSSRKGSTSKPI